MKLSFNCVHLCDLADQCEDFSDKLYLALDFINPHYRKFKSLSLEDFHDLLEFLDVDYLKNVYNADDLNGSLKTFSYEFYHLDTHLRDLFPAKLVNKIENIYEAIEAGKKFTYKE